jgi:ABC-type lipoprotein release transport system permease subunit
MTAERLEGYAMRFYLYVALKNVFRQKKRSFTLGINYAVVTFILVLLFAFSQGATHNITTNLVRSSAGHITVAGTYTVSGRVFQGVRNYPEIARVARETLGQEVTVLPRYAVSSALYYKGISKRLTFTGVDTGVDNGVKDQLTFVSGGWDRLLAADNGVLVPKDVAEYFGLAVDDDVVISTRTRFGAFNTGTLKISGIYVTDNFFIQSLVLCRFSFLQGLDLAEKGTASTVFLYFSNPSRLAEKRDRLAAALTDAGFEAGRPANANAAVAAVSSASPSYEVDTSGKDRTRLTLSTIDEAVGLVRTVTAAVNAVGTLIALIMLFIIAISIFINLRMTINERLREIGTMRTIGVEAGGVTALFVLESVFLALLFCILGVAAALVVVAAFAWLIPLPLGGAAALFLNKGHFVLIPRFTDGLLIVAVITFFSAFFSFFPARFGGRIKPVEALTRVF